MNVYNLNDYFEFHFNLSRFDTGAAADADATPTWRCYEENNDTVVTNDDCAKRDDANTTGYYYARGQITGAAGFELGKNYVVRAAATVNSVAAAAVIGTFKVISVTRGLAGTALPDAAADAAGGLPISDAGGLDLDTLNTNVSSILTDTGTDGVLIAAGAITATAIATGAIDADAIADNAIDAGAIANDAITAAKIANGAIDAATFAANAITSSVIADDAITAAKINTGAFTADAFAADAIVAATLATGAITADAFAADALVAATFATNSITADALAADAITEIQTGLALETTSQSILTDTGTTLDGKLDTIIGYLPTSPAKNVALANFVFLMTLSSDHLTPATSKTITAEISKDGAAFGAVVDAVGEIGSGFYKVDLSQSEMNADVIALKFTEADCDQRSIVIVTSG